MTSTHAGGPVSRAIKAIGAFVAGLLNGATGTPVPPSTERTPDTKPPADSR